MSDVKKTVETLKYQGDSLHVRFTPKYIQDVNSNVHTYLSPEFCLSGSALVQVEFQWRIVQKNKWETSWNDETVACIRFEKLRNDDKLKYTLNFVLCKNEKSENSETGYTEIAKGSINSQSFGTGHWTVMYRFNDMKVNQSICSIAIDLEPSLSLFATFLSDQDSSESVEVCGKNGSVYFHPEVLIIISQVLRTMLKGDWKEAQSRRIELPNTTKETLEHLKDYIYLEKLPTTGLVQLLLLANYLNIPDLEEKTSFKILGKLDGKNAHALLMCAGQHDIRTLYFGILEAIHYDVLKLCDLDVQCKELPLV